MLLGKNDHIKLGDFGWSNYQDKLKKRQTYCGTVDYLAPEMADRNHKHDQNVDIWSIGVLIFELMTGKAPFSPSVDHGFNMHQAERKTKENIITLKYQFPEGFPVAAKDLSRRILVLNPKKRYTIRQILNHPWIKQFKFGAANLQKKQRKNSGLEKSYDDDFKIFVSKRINSSITPEEKGPGRPPRPTPKCEEGLDFTPDELKNYIRPDSIIGNKKLSFKYYKPPKATKNLLSKKLGSNAFM